MANMASHSVNALAQDWENLIYIDPAIVNSATEWILGFQTTQGAFTETPNYKHPLDSKTNPTVGDARLGP